jgi:hypothetical protein
MPKAKPERPSAQSPSVGPAFVASLRMLRTRSVVTLALGAAVVLSLLSVCCGLGLVTTPWFLCELFAVQLALCTGRPMARGLSFVPAGLVMLGAVLLVSAVAWITLLGTGPELPTQTPRLFNLTTLMQSGGFYAVMSSALALLVITPLLYAPLILIEQQGRFDAALVESVRLVVTRGVFASVRLSLLAHAVQIAPLLIASSLALMFDPNQLSLFALCATPWLCASVPLGQGMIVWTYTQVREERTPAPPDPDPRVVAALRSTGAHVHVWTLLIVLPIATLVLTELSLVRPSRIQLGTSPEGQLIAVLTPAATGSSRVVLPDTALEVSATTNTLTIRASDGGGAGVLPLRAATPIRQVRVLRIRDAFALELSQADETFVTWVDRAGVRLDDDLRVRLLDRVSPLELFVMLCALLSTGVATMPILNGLGRVQRGYRMPLARRPSQDVLALDLAQSLRRARICAVLLLPLCLACFAIALHAVGVLS